MTGRVGRSAQTPEQFTKIIGELRSLRTAFDDARPRDMTVMFYIHAFNQYDTVVRDLLDTLEGTVNSASEVI